MKRENEKRDRENKDTEHFYERLNLLKEILKL